jgi:peptidoglycan/LPS O-acetylase OafA/YrhL
MSTLSTVVEQIKVEKRADSFYRPGLDILRALAFLFVFVAHGLVTNVDKSSRVGAIARTGEFGVCIFFFLSAYLITELLLREKRDTGKIAIPAFYARRVLRIWPLYFGMIFFAWFVGHFTLKHGLSGAWLAALLFLCANWYTVSHDYPPGFLFPLWSISLEEQFYLIWPWLVKYLGPGSLLGISSLIMATSYLAIARLLAQGASIDPGLWVNSLVQFQFFALGTMTAVLLRGRLLSPPVWVRWGLFLAGMLCMRAAQAAVFNQNPGMPADFTHIAPRFMISLAGCLCLFFSFLSLKGQAGQKYVVYLGKISYGLYVFHILFLSIGRAIVRHLPLGTLGPLTFQLLVMAIALPLTICMGVISYRFYESPFLQFKKRFTVVRSRPV